MVLTKHEVRKIHDKLRFYKDLINYTECISLLNEPFGSFLTYRMITKCPNGTVCRERRPQSFHSGNILTKSNMLFGSLQCAQCHGFVDIATNGLIDVFLLHLG